MSDATPTLASVVQDARRAMGETQTALAARTGVDVAVVERLELGEVTSSRDLRKLLDALGVDPVPHLGGMPHGPVLVTAVDDDHARVMAYLSELWDGRDGWLLFPDVAAYPPVEGWEEGALARSGAAMDGWVPSTRPGGRWSFVAVVVSCVVMMVAWLRASAEVADGARSAWLALSAVALIVASLATIASRLTGTRDADVVNPHVGEYERQVGLMAETGFRAATTHDLSRRGYAVSERGVTAYEADPRGLVTKDFLASSFRSVSMTDVGPGHVQVDVDTIVGSLEMRWLRRTPDLVRLVETWSDRAAGRGPKGLQ